jgi:exosortase
MPSVYSQVITATFQAEADDRPATHDRVAKWLLLSLPLALLVVFSQAIYQTAEVIVTSDDMAHGLFAPFISGIIAWEKRHDFRNALRPSAWGLLGLLVAGLLAVAGSVGESATIVRVAGLLSAASCIVLAGGCQGLRIMAVPLLLLLFAFPLPQVLYGDITLPLQLLASRLSEVTFELLGYSVFREGNVLQLSHQRLSVAEACSGLRSLVTLNFFSFVYVYFLEQRNRIRFSVVLTVVPAAIFMNVVRIVTTGILAKYAPEYTHGTYHEVLGWMCFGIGFLLVFSVHRALITLESWRDLR